MSTEFLRLYHELDRVYPNDINLDVRYEKERKEVLKTLGYQVQGLAPRIESSKHHGKMARRTQLEKKREAIVADHAAESRKKRALHSMVVEADKLNAAVAEFTKLIKNNEPIPRQLWQALAPSTEGNHGTSSSKLNPLKTTATTTTTINGITSLPDLTSSSKRLSELNPVQSSSARVYVPTMARHSSKASKSFTLNRWTTEERERLNMLYLEIPRPPAANPAMWRVYYETIAARFVTFFPLRDVNSVILKLEDMLMYKQMKEDGEVMYWKHCTNKS